MENFIIKNRLIDLLIKALHLEEEEFDSNKKLVDYGMDSITGVEFVKSINQEFSLNLSATEIYDYPTINELIVLISSNLPEKPEDIIENKENTTITKPNFVSLKTSKNSGYLVKTNQDLSETYFEDIALEMPNIGEVQIAVKASSINFPDIMCVKGIYPTMPSYPFVPGFEVSGIIEKLGEGVPSSFLGTEVIALTGEQMGGHAHYVNVSVENLIRKPANLTHEEACSLPIVFGTTYYALKKAELKEGENILIQTAAGGCGLMAVQLTNLLGATPIGTSSKENKLEFLDSIGVNYQGNYADIDFEESMLYMSNERGFDVVLNMLSGEMIQTGLNLLGSMGRYIELAVHGLRASAKLDLSGLIDNQVFRSIDLRRMLRSENEEQLLELQESFSKMVMLVEQNNIIPIVSRVYPLSMIAEAMSYVESGKHIGKVVISHTVTEMIDYEEDLQHKLKSQKEKALSEHIDIFDAVKEETKEAAPVSNNPNEVTLGSTDIAIVGISAQMPGSRTKEEFWENIKNGVNSVKEVPEERWKKEEYYSEDFAEKGKSYSKWMGMLDGVDEFEPLFFNISPREAELMDPQHRLWLEEGWKVIEDAGYSPDVLANYKCGVFIGVGSGDYVSNINQDAIENHLTLTGNSSSIISARLSYLLNLKGPSMAIDTACSSSLVAIAQACDSIVLGNSEMALAGGVCVMSTPQMHIMASKAGMLSKDGKCHTFDQNANGFVPAEGVGIVFLKKLADAKKDNDQIYGVIKGWGVNQDGATNGIAAPSKDSQVKLQTTVYNKFNIDPESLSYIEAHGTGTKLGDPIEIEALIKTYKQYTDKENYIGVGSVKTNIGHALTAAGVSGIIKVLLQMKHKQIAPTINYNKLNEHISLKGSPFYINTELKAWDTENNQLRKAAVSSFGFSGTNAHLVIEEYIKEPNNYKGNDSSIILISAKDKDKLKDKVTNLLAFLEEKQEVNLYDIAYTLQIGREFMNERLSFIVSTIEELKSKLNTYILGEKEGLFTGNIKKNHSDILFEGKAGQAYVREAILSNESNSLAQLWSKGIDIDWNLIYENSSPNKISLPSYPFAREQYWIPDAESKNSFSSNRKNQGEGIVSNNECLESVDKDKDLDIHQPIPSTHIYNNHWEECDPKIKNVKSQKNAHLILVVDGSKKLADTLSKTLKINVETISKNPEITYFNEVFNRVKKVMKSKTPISITVVVRNRDYLKYNFISGLLKTAHLENSKINGKIIGVDSISLSAKEELTNILTAEKLTNTVEIRYKNNKREERIFSPVALESKLDKTKIKEGGVYLITGGAGGLGLVFAKHIRKTKNTRIILIGRSELNKDRKTNIEAISNCEYHTCDLEDKLLVKGLIKNIKSTHGKLDGIIHSAGVNRDSLIINKKSTEIKEVLSAKIIGTKNLDEATQNEALDFMVLFSSLAGAIGNIGQSVYAAANAYLDNFALFRNLEKTKGKRKGKTISLNWPLWENGGMELDERTVKYMLNEWSLYPLTSLEGVALFEKALKGSTEIGLVLYGDDVTKMNTRLNIHNDTNIDELIKKIMSIDSFESVDDFIDQIPNEDLTDLISIFENDEY